MRASASTLTLTVLLAACGGEASAPGPDLLPQSYAVSECGGFKTHTAAELAPAPQSYCDAEVLRWTYDKSAGKLAFANDRVALNCCGERVMKLAEVNGAYEIRETDAPEQIVTASGTSEARCHCMCVFDLEVEAEQIPPGQIQVKLVREITDSNEPAKTVYSGTLDLSAGSGLVVVDSSPLMMDASGRCGM